MIAVALGDFVPRKAVILSSALADLDRSEQRSEAAGHRPVIACGKAVEQTRPESIAASRGIDDFSGLDTGNLDLSAAFMDERAASPQCDHESAYEFRKLLDRASHAPAASALRSR